MEDDDGAGGEILGCETAEEKAAAVMVGRFGLIELNGAAMLPRSLRYVARRSKN